MSLSLGREGRCQGVAETGGGGGAGWVPPAQGPTGRTWGGHLRHPQTRALGLSLPSNVQSRLWLCWQRGPRVHGPTQATSTNPLHANDPAQTVVPQQDNTESRNPCRSRFQGEMDSPAHPTKGCKLMMRKEDTPKQDPCSGMFF